MSRPHLPALPQREGPNLAAPAEVVTARPDSGRVAVPNVPPSILSSKPTVVGLLAAFRRCWRLATGLGLIVAAAAAVTAWYLTSPTSYTAATTLRVDSTLPRLLFETKDGPDFSTYQRSQVALVKSRFVLNSALRDPKVVQLAIVRQQEDPIEWLTKELQVDFGLSPEILRISMTGKDSEALIVLVDAIRDAYLREVVNKQHTQRLARLEQLKNMYTEFDDLLKNKRKVLRELAENLGSKDARVLAVRQEFALNELHTLQQELLGLQSQLRRAKLETSTKLDKEKGLEAVSVPDSLVEEALRKDPVVAGYDKEIARLDQDIARYRDRSPNPAAEPTYVQKQAEIVAIRKGMATRRAELTPKIIDELRVQRRFESERAQTEQQEKVAHLEKLDALLTKQVRERGEESNSFGKKTIDLEGLREEIELTEQVWKKAGSEVEALKVEIQAPSRVTPNEESAYATKREGMGIKAALGGGLGGFALVLLSISFLEFRSRRLVNAGEVSHGLRLPVIGTMPRVRLGDGRSTSRSVDSSAAVSQRLMIESVDAALAVILHASRRTSLRVVMVTSAVGGEGKTMLSAHLTASLARAGWRALLVDADFRRPSLHTVFGLADQAGLSEVLRGEADIRDVMQPGPMEGLWVVSAGHSDSHSMQGLAQGALRGIFDQVKGDFDLIVVDSAPVLPVVDSQLIAQAVDGVILSVLQDVSRLPLIHAAYERLMLFQVSILGAVVQGADVGKAYGFQYPYTPVPAAKAASPTNLE